MLAIIAWRIGTRMENYDQQTSSMVEDQPLEQNQSEYQDYESPPLSQPKKHIFQKTYNEDEYSNKVLEDGK